MYVQAKTIHDRLVQLELPLFSFLEGPVMNCVEEINTDPYQLLESHLPYNYTALDDDELCMLIEETCISMASSEEDETAYLTPTKVRMSQQDLSQFKYRFFPDHGFQLLNDEVSPTSDPLYAA